jgi:hypothetical protein
MSLLEQELAIMAEVYAARGGVTLATQEVRNMGDKVSSCFGLK